MFKNLSTTDERSKDFLITKQDSSCKLLNSVVSAILAKKAVESLEFFAVLAVSANNKRQCESRIQIKHLYTQRLVGSYVPFKCDRGC